jgi:hypothetical protein
MTIYSYRNIVFVALMAVLGQGTATFAAETAAKADSMEPAALDKLVANKPGSSTAPISQIDSDKPMAINFSDFVKDGAGCGVPNLDTSAK